MLRFMKQKLPWISFKRSSRDINSFELWSITETKNDQWWQTTVIPELNTFMTSNTIFIALGIPDSYLEKTALIKSTLPPGSYKTSLDTSSPPKSLSLHRKQINKVKNELDEQPSSLLACKSFSPMHLVFLEYDTHRPQLAWILIYLIKTATSLPRGHSISNY